MTLRKTLARPALAATVLFVATGLTFAHVTVAPKEAANGTSARLVFTVPHGCDGAATTGLDVKIPEGFVAAKPQPKAGWQIEIAKGDYAKSYKLYGEDVKAGGIDIKWAGGTLPDDEFDEFVIEGNVQGFDAPTRLVFPTIQSCGATSINWTDVPAAGQEAHSLKHPAPGVDVTLAAAADDMPGMDMSNMNMAASAKATTSGPVTVGDLTISGGFSRAMLPGQPTGGGYFSISNAGKTADTLIGASSVAAQSVTLHEMKMNGSVMEMRALPQGIDIPAGGTVTLTPDGLHLMFEKVTAPFKAGTSVAVTLSFAMAGKVDMALPVGAINATGPTVGN